MNEVVSLINEKTINIEIELLENQLGTIPKNKKIFKEYIAKNVASELAEEEAKGIVDDSESNTGWTTFMEDEQGLYILDYMILGFIRYAGNTLKEIVPAAKNKTGIKALKSKLENFCFVTPRKIRFERNDEILKECDGQIERPLRAMTMQGPRVTIAKSDYIEKGTILKFSIKLIENKEITEETLKYLFEYGRYKGLGQFRNGSYGQFKVNKFEVM